MNTLVVIALMQAVVYGVIAALSNAFAYGTDEQSRPILTVLALFAASFVLYLVAIRCAVRCAPGRRLGWVIVVPAIVFRLILVPTAPIQETDVYRYVWDGAVAGSGFNPYRYAPAQIATAAPEADLADELRPLVNLRNTSSSMAEVLRRIHYAELTTIYPPISQAVFALGDWLTPDHASVDARVTILKIVLLAFDLGTIALVWLLLKTAGRHVGWVVAYAWCPLVMKEFANSGHLDAIAVFFATAAVYCVARSITRDSQGTHAGAASVGAIMLALAIGAKLFAIVLLPVLCAAIASRFRISIAVLFMSVAVSLSMACLAPMLLTTPASASIPPPLPQHTARLPIHTEAQSHSEADQGGMLAAASGLKAFVSRWEMNDFLFMLLVENLRPAADDSRAPSVWFVVTPSAWRDAIVLPIANWVGTDRATAAFVLTRVVTSFIFLAIALVLATRVYRHANPITLPEAAFLTLAWFWLLSPTQNPWYWVWALPVLPFARGRAWYTMSGFVLLYYLRFWLRYHFPTGPVCGVNYNGAQFFDFVITWLEYAPWFAWLAIATARARHRTDDDLRRYPENVGGFTDAKDETTYHHVRIRNQSGAEPK